jgi:hypothetical protein
MLGIGEAVRRETLAGLVAARDDWILLGFARLAAVWVERPVPLPTHRMLESPEQ